MKYRVALFFLAVIGLASPGLGLEPTEQAFSQFTIGKSTHFIYRREGLRVWTNDESIALLESAYSYYSDLFQRRLSYIVNIRDQIADEPSATNTLGLDSSHILLKFPIRFGINADEKGLAYHFLTHELLHCWIGGNTKSHGDIIEALVQYQTDLFLSENNYFPDRNVTEAATMEKDASQIAKAYREFHKLRDASPQAYLRLLKDMAAAFAATKDGQSVEVEPLLRKHLGSGLLGNISAHARSETNARQGWAGIAIQDAGVVVNRVLPASPAEKAGLRPGDVILDWNDERVRGKRDFVQRVGTTAVGTTIKLRILRDNDVQTINLQIVEKSSPIQ